MNHPRASASEEAMNRQVPIRLATAPIAEAIIEVRFATNEGFLVEDELPVLLSGLFGRWTKIERTEFADIPHSVRAATLDLPFKPVRRIVWEGFVALVSDRALAIIVQEPYPGWDVFSAWAAAAIESLFAAGVITDIDRMATRYVNFIEDREDAQSFDLVTVRIETGQMNAAEVGKRVRFEVLEDKVVSVVQIHSGQRQIAGAKGPASGLLVDIDAIWQGQEIKSPAEALRALSEVHEEEKRVFFEVLTRESADHYGPIYEEKNRA